MEKIDDRIANIYRVLFALAIEVDVEPEELAESVRSSDVEGYTSAFHRELKRLRMEEEVRNVYHRKQ